MWSPFRRNGRARPLEQQVLESLSRAIALAPDLVELRAGLATEFMRIGRAEAAALLEYDDLRQGYVERSPRRIAPDLCIPRLGRLVQWFEINEAPLGIPDPRGAHRVLTEDERAACSRLGVKACVPLIAVNRLVAIVLLTSSDPRWQVTRGNASVIDACARHAALAYEAATRRAREIQRIRDSLRAEQFAEAGRLAAAVAHEVRNPLTAIRSTLQFARSTEGSPDLHRELLDEALENIDRIDRTMAGILRLSRPATLHREEVDLVAIARDALDQAAAAGRSSAIQVEARFEIRPLPVLGDADELRSVLVNLIVNACQAMEGGGVLTVRSALVTAERAGAASLSARIDVADTGSGMTGDVLLRVFEPFYSTRPLGTGLGLPISLEIVRRHDGELSFSSEPGRGTVATVLLPVRPVA